MTISEVLDALETAMGDPLSAQQRAVVLWVVRGLTYPQIGAELGISVQMVKQHSVLAQAKLRCRSRREIERLVWGRMPLYRAATCTARPS